jgi:Asp-tRNA(Asn)/Glu-tRNA(Gln) amidotransferase A subunit family amidase
VNSDCASELLRLSAAEVAAQLRVGAISARDYALALLERVREAEDQVQAWACLDPDFLLAQANAADQARGAGAAHGALHGVPVGLKDIIDTADLRTENGTVLHAGRQPRDDAAVAARVRAAGGLVMGKTVTTELATYAPGKTRNPRNLAHTPGGSSSGSAAAVAAGMVPLAIGTQTNGSVIRPASFCGVVGYKPTAGWVPRTGVLVQSPALDQVGVFGRSVEDVALLVQCLCGSDPADPATRARAMPALFATARSAPPAAPVLGFVRTPMWDRMAADAQAAFTEFAHFLDGRMTDVDLPDGAIDVLGLHRLIMEADIAASFDNEYERGRSQLSVSLRSQIERGRTITATDYRRALERRDRVSAAFDGMFEEVDAVLTPATLGTAPHGLESTGDPVMCTMWTFTGQPAICLPLLHGVNGLPIGVQLVGRRDDDARLLRTAQWLTSLAAAA